MPTGFRLPPAGAGGWSAPLIFASRATTPTGAAGAATPAGTTTPAGAATATGAATASSAIPPSALPPYTAALTHHVSCLCITLVLQFLPDREAEKGDSHGSHCRFRDLTSRDTGSSRDIRFGTLS